MKEPRIVITGLGALTPIGNNTKQYSENLSKGTTGAANITKFDTTNFKTKFACEIKNYDPLNHFEKKEIKKLDEFSQYALITTQEAINDSKIQINKEKTDKIGVIWGSGVGGLKSIQDQIIEFTKNNYNPRFSPFFIPKMIADIAAGHISIKYGIKGANYSTISACASSTNAIIDAYNLIKLRHLDIAITGGSEAAINQTGIAGFNALRALSTNNQNPQTASKPFSKGRDGFVMGEGSATLILETLQHAQNRKAKIYAEIIGIGMSADAHHITQPHPQGQGIILAMQKALQNANTEPKHVDHINTHGTATQLGDIAEAQAIEKVFKQHAYNININSTKSMIGHLLGASGAIETIATILAIQKQQIPPTINCTQKDPQINPKLNFTFNKPQQKNINIAITNNFGFGGHNCCIVLKKYQP